VADINPIFKATRDPDAELWLLTGPRWAGFIQQALRTAQESIFFSVYLLSSNWSGQYQGTTNLLKDICHHGKRLTTAGKICRAILGHPKQSERVASFNMAAANAMQEAGWSVRIMPARRVLHEKIWVFDKRVAVIGSHNVSISSAVANLDCSVGIHSEIFASELMTSWWRHWNLAEPYRGTGEKADGMGEELDSTSRFRDRFQKGGTAGGRRII
jgi:phosphatidylserine/phosphatidylglycerophosphate/cardiolipin synthase-like enzyme